MKVVILAGGRGTRMESETITMPKPMLEIGGKPFLWHIMKIYSHYGFNDFVLCLGYKGNIIRDYFFNYARNNYDCKIEMNNDSCHTTLLEVNKEADWQVTLVDTGLETQTGSRLSRIEKYVENERFLCTYGDGVADIDIATLVTNHNYNVYTKGIYATLTSVYSKSKFGEIETEDDIIVSFEEKSKTSWINGGFFVFEPKIFDYIIGDNDPLEQGALTWLTENRKLSVYKHDKFWACADSPKELKSLNDMWNLNIRPWKVW